MLNFGRVWFWSCFWCRKLVKLMIYPCGKGFFKFKEVPGWYTESVCNVQPQPRRMETLRLMPSNYFYSQIHKMLALQGKARAFLNRMISAVCHLFLVINADCTDAFDLSCPWWLWEVESLELMNTSWTAWMKIHSAQPTTVWMDESPT